MLIESAQHAGTVEDRAVSAAASRLTEHLPRDQALGLRLMALARAAAAMHAAELAAPGRAPATLDTQASRLLALVNDRCGRTVEAAGIAQPRRGAE